MAYTALPTKNPGDLLTSALWNTYLQGNADSGFCRMIADYTVSGSSVANITFASIPATFAHLMMIVSGRNTSASTTYNDLLLQFNGDTAAHYADANFTGSAGNTTMIVGQLADGATTANRFFGNLLLFPHYLDTANYQVVLNAISGGWYTAPTQFANQGVGSWDQTAAVTQILLKSATANLAIGTRATLYGLPQ